MNITKPYIVELAPTLTEHWYNVWKAKPDGTKGRYIGAHPSSTTILLAYPQSPFLTKWIAENGWHESQRIKEAKGVSGTRIHNACDLLESGVELQREDYSLEEWYKISAFVDWFNAMRPITIAREYPVFSRKGKYAGRLDRIYSIDGEMTLLDFKSSSAIHEHFALQFASYAKAIEETTDLKIAQTACLQLGAANKNHYRYVIYPEWREHYKVFEHVRATWQYDRFDSKRKLKEPPILNLPASLKLSFIEPVKTND